MRGQGQGLGQFMNVRGKRVYVYMCAPEDENVYALHEAE